MNLAPHRCWYPAFVIYRWRLVLWILPLLACLGLLGLHWNRLRVDHALAVVQLRPTTAVLAGRPVPAWMSEQIDIICSSVVLGKVARDCGLAAAWGMSDAETVERLRDHVSCDAIPGTSLVELKVRKVSGADALELCKAITKHAGELLEADRGAETARQAAERLAVAKKAVAEIEAKLVAAHAKFIAETPGSGQVVDVGSRFESLVEIQAERRLLEQLKLQIAWEGVGGCVLMEGALIEHEAAHWPRLPPQHHLEDLAIAGGWTFGVSVLLAIVLAYVLEMLVPRKARREELSPEFPPQHGYP